MSSKTSLVGGKQLLVVGSGGREHAICWKLSQSEQVVKIYALPGSHGIAQVPKCSNLSGVNAKDFQGIANWCKKQSIDLVIVGPEDPLANGLGDALNKAGVRCFGPNKKGAQIEADKKWAKDFMLRHSIPTARYESFTDVKKAKEFINNASYKALVVKAAGLAAGKGVVVAADAAEACQAVDEILGQRKYGNAGETVVIEELLVGEEVSVLAFVDTHYAQAMLPAQDHKRLRDGDEGPNTGGMGAYCPCPLIPPDDLERINRAILQKAVDALRQEGIHYCGVLYAGLMLTADGPKVLEFNCRFGDPETQVILPLLETDLYAIMSACVENRLKEVTLQWREDVSAVGVVMASAGYPETSTKGCIIEGVPPLTANELIFHSGVAVDKAGRFLTNGGRVLIAVALRKDLRQAAADATRICQGITFVGGAAQFRTDIAEKAFKMLKANNAPMLKGLSYKDSGVDIDAGDDLVQRIKPLSRGTQRPGVVGGLGGFGGLFRLNELNYTNPVISEAINGVGTKIKLALEQKMYESIGYDLLAMCANDVLESGAEPVAFLDYIACGKLQVPVAAQIVKGIAEGCRAADCALLGGETAEMPSVYEVGKYDIAGYCVGILEAGKELPKFKQYEEGDLLISLPANGLHCAGFHALLKQLEAADIDLAEKCEFGDDTKSLGQQLCEPSRIYVKEILALLRECDVKAISHIGTGLLPDVQRIIPPDHEISLDFGDLKIPTIYGWLAAKLRLSPQTLLDNLNCGIGLVVIVPKKCTVWKSLLGAGAKVFGVLKRKLQTCHQKHQIEVRNFVEGLEKIADRFGGLSERHARTLDEPHQRDLALELCDGALTQQRNGSFTTKLGRRLTPVPQTYKDPVLVLGTDGVGSKIKIAQQTDRNGTVGVDLVAMCVNDILCNGAEPLTFSSYYACGDLVEEVAATITGGVIEGASQAGSSLVETHIAEVPLLYASDVYDLAGFSLGIAEYPRLLPRTDEIRAGDVLIGLPSSGVHSNGFSLVHAIMKRAGVTFEDKAPFSPYTFGEELLTPTRIYVKALLPLLRQGYVKALAHITGGGLTENIPRVLPKNLAVELDATQWNIPPVFGWLAAQGNVAPAEMQRTYNCGLGIILVVAPELEQSVLAELQYCERAAHIGVVVQRAQPEAPQVVVENFSRCLKRVQELQGKPRKRVAVLISGTGSNLLALIDACRDTSQGVHADIVLVISNKADVLGLERAKNAGIQAVVVSHKQYAKREDFDAEMSRKLVEHNVDLVCLAGFMRVLSEQFVREWRGRLVNIHPSLLPKHPGLKVQKKALDAGDKESGCTVHFVDEGVDTGAIIVQASVPILPNDTEETLTNRIHIAEHFAFPKALRLLATDAVKLSQDGKTTFT
ncbi:PREDICTED: trifunctional purine biosynthetic protein adenosine-3 [Rhagoletis zephyria]|uniref:trifunctional purine biosynthetic protein adenosine-3 n=1 Tax=Rhagoletis zephyria TaxID=28612 RepID=UPI000811A863|nr:PREDICTED: trifunctional purine biosynthetic protein adenosine-3 [Rhagoletis zephyria]